VLPVGPVTPVLVAVPELPFSPVGPAGPVAPNPFICCTCGAYFAAQILVHAESFGGFPKPFVLMACFFIFLLILYLIFISK
jgi:hypothetical protein